MPQLFVRLRAACKCLLTLLETALASFSATPNHRWIISVVATLLLLPTQHPDLLIELINCLGPLRVVFEFVGVLEHLLHVVLGHGLS